jgi:putative nucleotidyltransferase with HDIG domain
LNRRRLTALLRNRVGRDPLLRSIRDAGRAVGGEVWLVGGYVRDTALGLCPGDIDLVAGRGSLRLIRAVESRWGVRSFRFRKRGVTTWRLAVERRPVDIVDAAARGLRRDLLRRELTVNAVAFDLDLGCLRDPLGGLADIRAGRLRLPHTRVLVEDPVRALRLARFLAQLPQFRLMGRTRSAAREASRAVRRASRERVRDELGRLLAAEAPHRGLDALADLGILERVLPELAPLRGCRAGRDRPDVWRHTVDAVELSTRAARLPGGGALRDAGRRLLLRWALLLHDVAKPDTLEIDETGKPSFHGHEVLGAERAETVLRRLRLPNVERRRIRRLVLNHLRPGHLADAGAPERGLRRLVREAGEDLPLLVAHSTCDARASGSPDAPARWRRLRRVLVRLLELSQAMSRSASPPIVSGRDLLCDLGLEPGPIVGRLLGAIREQQDLGRIASRREALEFAARLLETGG